MKNIDWGKWTTAASVILFFVWMQRHHRWGYLRTAMSGKLTVAGAQSAGATFFSPSTKKTKTNPKTNIPTPIHRPTTQQPGMR